MSANQLKVQQTYSLRRHVAVGKSLRNMWRHYTYHTASFTSERTKLHQTLIDASLPKQAPVKGEKPKVILIIGGAGSGKSKVIKTINARQQFAHLDSDIFKEGLATHEVEQNPKLKRSHLLGVLQREAVFVRQEAFRQAVRGKKNVIFESVGSNASAIQANIDILVAKGFDIELHLVDTKEELAIDRVSSRNKRSERQVSLGYTKKSNRRARVTYETLARKNHGKVSTHRWTNNAEKPQRDDQEDINVLFKVIIDDLKESREKLLNGLNERDKEQPHIKQHIQMLTRLLDMNSKDRNPQEMLLALISDMAIFPEIYINYRKNLSSLFKLIDKNDFHVYYTSIRRKGPMKSHGDVMIGSPGLAQGIGLSAAGDPRRGKLKLPKEFRHRLLSALKEKPAFPVNVLKRLGTREKIIEMFAVNENGDFNIEHFDAHSLTYLINHATPELLDEFNSKILFNPKLNVRFELWDKPRSSLQNKDSALFNRQFPMFLKEQTYSSFRRGIGHVHHSITRSVAIREQKHVAPSTAIKRWIALTSHRVKLDAKRGLKYNTENAFWHFQGTARNKRGGNCNTISTHLLGRNAETASIFNFGAFKGKKLILPRSSPMQVGSKSPFRTARSGNKYEDMLREAHVAKLIVHNPKPYQNAVLRVNQKIIDYLPHIKGAKLKLLSLTIKEYFSEFDSHKDDAKIFLKNKLSSKSPEDIYRCLLFHKVFFEEIFSKPLAATIRDRREYFRMRPVHLFGKKSRGKKGVASTLKYDNSIGLMRLHNVAKLELNHNSFNSLTTRAPGCSQTTFIDREKRLQAFKDTHPDKWADKSTFSEQILQNDGLFASGASGTVTTTLPYIFSTILKDDPLAQEDYLMASAAALVYAGHHSFFEMLAPLRHMRRDCPDRFKDIRANDPEFYDKVLTVRFKRFINHKPNSVVLSRSEQMNQSLRADLNSMNHQLNSQNPPCSQFSPQCDLEKQRDNLLRLIKKKVSRLYKQSKANKHIFLSGIQERLRTIKLDNLSDVAEFFVFLHKAEAFETKKFQGFTSFSRFTSKEGKSITETQWLVNQVDDFMQGVKATTTAAEKFNLKKRVRSVFKKAMSEEPYSDTVREELQSEIQTLRDELSSNSIDEVLKTSLNSMLSTAKERMEQGPSASMRYK